MRPLFVGIILSALLTTSAFACGPNTNGVRRLPTWPPAAAIDKLLPHAKLDDAELRHLKALRAEIAELVARDKMQKAHTVEVEAMTILGYIETPGWFRGGFVWKKSYPKRRTLRQATTEMPLYGARPKGFFDRT